MNKSSLIITVQGLANRAAICKRGMKRLPNYPEWTNLMQGEYEGLIYAAKTIVRHAKIWGVW